MQGCERASHVLTNCFVSARPSTTGCARPRARASECRGRGRRYVRFGLGNTAHAANGVHGLTCRDG
jgi:hypothetical protein